MLLTACRSVSPPMASYAYVQFARAGDLDPNAAVLRPVSKGSEDKFRRGLSRVKPGHQGFKVDFKRARSIKENAFIHSAIREMFDNQPEGGEFDNYDRFFDQIKLEAGWVFDDPLIKESTGEVCWRLKPTNFDDCGHDEIQEFKTALRGVYYRRMGEHATSVRFGL